MFIYKENFHTFISDPQKIIEMLPFILLYAFSIFLALLIREKTRHYFFQTLTKDYILSEKRNFTRFGFLSAWGTFLFLITGLGYSRSYSFNYRKLSVSKRLLILFSAPIINFIIAGLAYYLSVSKAQIFSYKYIQIFLYFFCYTNFIVVFINLFPFPFSDLIVIVSGFQTGLYAFEIIQIIIVIIAALFKIHLYFFNYFIFLMDKII